jgi:hypothetical protein
VVGRDEALTSLRREVTGREFEFATVLEVTDGGPSGFLLHVRSGQRLHPHTLVVAADGSSLSLDYVTGDPLPAEDAQLWAEGVVMWLMEQLDTGVLRWGRRVTLPDGTVAIDPMLEPERASPWWVSPVPLERPTQAGQRRLRRLTKRRRNRRVAMAGDSTHVAIGGDRLALERDPAPGSHLRDAGFDVRPGRAAHAEGRLIQWLQLNLDDSGASPPAGQLVVAWRDASEAIVLLEHLECEPSVPGGAVEELMLAGIHAAADAGARVIDHRFNDADHLEQGLPWQPEDGARRLNAADVP